MREYRVAFIHIGVAFIGRGLILVSMIGYVDKKVKSLVFHESIWQMLFRFFIYFNLSHTLTKYLI